MVAFGDFNTNRTLGILLIPQYEGSKIGILTSTFGFRKIINEATHILNNFFFLHGLNTCVTIEFSNRITCSFFSPCELSSANNICKI